MSITVSLGEESAYEVGEGETRTEGHPPSDRTTPTNSTTKKTKQLTYQGANTEEGATSE